MEVECFGRMGVRPACKWPGRCTIDDLIIHFSLGLIPRLSQIKGWSTGLEGVRHPSDQEMREKEEGKEVRVQTAELSQDAAPSTKRKELDSLRPESQYHQ